MRKRQSCGTVLGFSMARISAAVVATLCLTAPLAAQSTDLAIESADGTQLHGSLERADGPIAALILPGSGATDRNGNIPGAVETDSYRFLAETLATGGITTLRIDKRGVGESGGDGNAVSLALYEQDTDAWVTALRAETGARCVWLIGHSEGGILALDAADLPGICGLVLLSAPGQNLGQSLLDQFGRIAVLDPILPQISDAIDDLAAGTTEIDVEGLPPGIAFLFTGPARDYVRELVVTEPEVLAAMAVVPMLVIGGGADFQVPATETARLAGAARQAEFTEIADMTHVLKAADPTDPAAITQTYSDPTQPLHPELGPLILDFIFDHQ